MSQNSVMDIPLKNERPLLDRHQIVNLVRKWGDVNTDGILDSACQIYTDPNIEGLIGYRIEANNAVVLGDPVCAAKDKPALAQSFHDYCSKLNLKIVYTIVSEEFTKWAKQNLLSVLIEFGEVFTLNPLNNPVDHKGPNAVLVRKKVKHAQQEGAVVEEYLGNDPQIENSIVELAKTWQKGRHGLQIYLAHITLFKDRIGKRWFYASQGGKIVGILLLNELKSRKGWLLNNVMITKDAPHGISELLIISTLQALEKENCQSVIIGPIPRKQLGKISGLGGFFSTVTHWVYRFATKVFHLYGHKTFWEKFEPTVHSSYLMFPEKNLSISSVRAILKAFNLNL